MSRCLQFSSQEYSHLQHHDYTILTARIRAVDITTVSTAKIGMTDHTYVSENEMDKDSPRNKEQRSVWYIDKHSH